MNFFRLSVWVMDKFKFIERQLLKLAHDTKSVKYQWKRKLFSKFGSSKLGVQLIYKCGLIVEVVNIHVILCLTF